MNKQAIANEIKTLNKADVEFEWFQLKDLQTEDIGDNTRLGCNLIDYYFLKHRLNTKGNKGISFYEFLYYKENYVDKAYFKKLINFAKATNRYKDSEIKFLYYCYGLCFGRIDAFKISNAMFVYDMFDIETILDPFAGFGGRMIGAMLRDINYIGIDSNIELKPDYERLLSDFKGEHSSSVKLYFQSSLDFDFSKVKYDMVLTSPPYYNIEQYEHQPKRSTEQWDDFYCTIFNRLWENLPNEGIMALNVNNKIFTKILLPLFGEPNFEFKLKKKQKGTYTESIFIWIK